MLAEGDDEEHFGVHITYADLYSCILFLTAIYFSGFLSARFLSLPNLVGEIFAGIVLGPNLLDVVPYVEAFVMLGEIGLILLVLEAGIDIDLTTLKLIGKRGILIALVGTLLPIVLAYLIAYLIGYRGTAAIAAGCAFAPTSLGIAMNVLRQSNLVNTPVGQVVVAAAIIDDMIALVILSQLQAFAGDEVPTTLDMIIPVVSALAFLLVGGSLAVFVLPKFLNRLILDRIEEGTHHNREWMSLAIMFLLFLGLFPATYAAKASPLMGAFLAGLVFCSNEGAHHMFLSQFKRVLQWLLRIFFAASIGFQVPIQMFANFTVLWQGSVFALALVGKIAVGFMVPNFSPTTMFKGMHLRDCLVVGFSMMAEGEFAFVIAVFAVSNGMITEELYASVVLAVLFSTILAPFFLRYSISYFNNEVKSTISGTSDNLNESLANAIQEQTALFFNIQIKSAPAWGLLVNIMDDLDELNLQVIDHRSWHPRQSHDLLINEVYALDSCMKSPETDELVLQRANQITSKIEKTIGQKEAVVKVQRWVPEMPGSSAKSTKEHLIHAASNLLRSASNLDVNPMEDDYVNMEEGGVKKLETDRNELLSHSLNKRYGRRLGGLFRRGFSTADHGIYGAVSEDSGEDIELHYWRYEAA